MRKPADKNNRNLQANEHSHRKIIYRQALGAVKHEMSGYKLDGNSFGPKFSRFSDEWHSGRVLLGLFRLFLFRNRNNRIHRISVPSKQIARYSENRIADVIKRDRRGRAIFPPKYHPDHSAIGSRMNGIALRSFRNRNNSQKDHKYRIFRTWSKQNSPKRTCPQSGFFNYICVSRKWYAFISFNAAVSHLWPTFLLRLTILFVAYAVSSWTISLSPSVWRAVEFRPPCASSETRSQSPLLSSPPEKLNKNWQGCALSSS